MTDREYFDCYERLSEILYEKHELDVDLFVSIFEGKVKPIIKNSFSGLADRFASIDLEDLYQDIFIKIWTRCVGAYFMNENYETSAAWFLGWCKTVAKNHVTSLLRKKSLKNNETLDDPEHPVTVSNSTDVSENIVNSDAVATVIKAASSLPSKAEMKLTWLGTYLLIYNGDASDRIEATHVFCERFADITFGSLLSEVKTMASQSPVLTGADVDFSSIEDELKGELKDARVGDALGGEPLSKVSDWLYKINKKLTGILPEEVMSWNT